MPLRKRRQPASKTLDELWESRQRLTPLLVGSMGTQDEGIESRRAHALFVVVDPDEIHGLRSVLEEQKTGREFDVVTRTGIGFPEDQTHAPFVLIGITFPEVGFAIEIPIDADRYRRSLVEGIRSQQLLIMDADKSIALQSMSAAKAWQVGLGLQVALTDVRPIAGALQQRADLPLPVYLPEAIQLNDHNRPRALEQFTEGARAPDAAAVTFRPDGTSAIVLVDFHRPNAPEGYGPDAPLLGRWGALSGGPKAVLRLDVFSINAPFASYLIIDEELRFVRAGAAGAHHVMLLKERTGDNVEANERIWQEGVVAWVERVESLRHVLHELG